MEGVLHHAFDELDAHLDEVLQLARYTGRGGLGGAAEQQDEDGAHQQRPAEGIQVERHEAHVTSFQTRLSDGPGGLIENGAISTLVTCRQLAVGEVLQVVLDIFSGGTRHKRLNAQCFGLFFISRSALAPTPRTSR